MSSMGALVVEVQGNAARTQEDMGRIVSVIDQSARRINASAAGASASISNIGRAGRTFGRIKGAEEAAASIDKVAHSSVGARREMLVLAHELSQGQFKRAAGSFMVLGERMDFMGKLMSPVGLAVGAVAVTVGALAVAAYKSAEAHKAFNNAIITTGNYAGVTEGRMMAMSDSVARSAGVTIGTAQEMTQGLLETGRLGAGALEHVATAAALMASLTGGKAEEVVKDFAKMSDGVLKWALEADKQYHFMTGALFDQVKALEDAGEKEQAMIVVSDALVAAKKREAEQLGETSGAWQTFKNWVSETTDEIGRFLSGTRTVEQRISDIKQALANAPKQGGLLEQGTQAGNHRATLTAQLSHLTFLQRQQQDAADADSFAKAEEEKTVKFKEEWAKRMASHHDTVTQMNKDIAKAQEEGAGAHAPQKDIDAEVARIRKEYQHKDGQSGIERAQTQGILQPLERQIQGEEKLLAFREKVLAQYHKSDLISDEGYYNTRKTVIEAAEKRIESLYDQEIAAAQTQAARVTDARAKIEANNKVEDLRMQKQAALQQISEAQAENNFELTQSTEKYRDEVTKLTAELDKLRHTQSNTAGANFDRANAGLRKQATAKNDTGTLQTLADARAATQAQADMNDLKERAKVIEDALKQTEAENQLLTQTGQQTELQNDLKIGDARTQAAQQLQVIADKMRDIAQQSGLPELTDQAAQFTLTVNQIKASSDVLGKTISDTMTGAFANSLLAVQNRTKSLRQAFADMANSIEQSLLKIVDNDIAQMLFGTGSGSIGASSNGGVSTSLFGKLVGLAISAFGASTGDPSGIGLGTGDGSTPADLMSGYSGRASGGSVLPGAMYEVNERGPELLNYANKTFLMMGDKGGTVTPASGAGGRQSVFNMNIAVPPGTTRQSAQQQAAEIMRHAQIAQARNG